MKYDYLWDKTGTDAEIEDLENALKAFRHTETAAPILPAKISVQAEKGTPRRRFEFFNLRFAFASLAIVLVVFSILLLQLGKDKYNPNNNLARQQTIQTSSVENPQTASIVNPVAPLPIVKIKNVNRQTDKKKVIKIRQNGAPVRSERTATARNPKIKQPAETLTAEEKKAYNQLMLALSFTSSKLKIVKDKAQGIDEKIAAVEAAK